jgi:hypothetical protein
MRPELIVRYLEAGRKRVALPDTFILDPAPTRPHENRIGVMAALAFLEKGRRVVAHFDWDRPGRLFRAPAGQVAGADLADEDRDLLHARHCYD